MAKKIVGYIKLQVPAGKANPSPPIGPALGQRGLNIMEFCKAFNAQTQGMEPGLVLPVVITAFADKSFTFILKTPPASVLIKKALKLEKGSAKPHLDKVGKLTRSQVEDIAKAKGLIINQSSSASYMPATAYGVTKATLTAINFGMAVQFAGDEIRAVAIAPGLMETEASRSSLSSETWQRVKSTQAMKRLGTAKDIANLGVFLASDEGSFINNEIILVDGGNMMRGFRP